VTIAETEVIQSESTAIVEVYDSPQDMTRKLANMKQMLVLTQKFFQEVMDPNVDYGTIPGTQKPTLLKPGAEKLSEFYGYAPTIRQIDEEKNIETGFYRARVTVSLVHKRTSTLIADGVGEANTYEGRYRYRWLSEYKLPKGIDKDALHSEERKNKNGETYIMYRVDNEDPWMLWNTVLKMAKKRALVDAVLSATRSSGLFTQDVEDLREWVAEDQYRAQGSAPSVATGDPGDVVVTFGKYKGKTVSEIYSSDKGYFDWMLQNNDKMKGTCQAYLDSLNNPAPEPTTNGNGNGKLTGGSTPAQQQKIHIVAQEKGYNTAVLIKERFGIESGSTKDLTKQQASDLITWLVDALPAQADGQQKLGGLEREPGDDDWPPIPEEEPSF